jgi:endonuclease-3 related protein
VFRLKTGKLASNQNTVRRNLRQAYELMFEHFGHRHWWPAETPFEVCVGAILTQNTNWGNVEQALSNLKRENLMQPSRLFALPESRLADLLRPAGYFNVKARRLRSFLKILVEQYGGQIHRLFEGTTDVVRERLLSINGVGPETADSMLLYAGGRARFVIDAYTKRIFHRHGWCHPEAKYAELQAICESGLNHQPPGKCLGYWQDFHAQFVAVGNRYCRPKNPRCEVCPLKPLL